MEENDKIPVTVYQIDLMPFEETGFEFVVDQIIHGANQRGYNYRIQRLNLEADVKHNIRVYFDCHKRPPKWKSFLQDILHEVSPIHQCINTVNSFLCFIQFDTEIYGICGGIGSFILDRYSTDNFGLEILVRILPKDSKTIRQIQNRGVTGVVLGQTKYFRGEQRISDENEFGKIFKEVKAQLSKLLLTRTFGFDVDDLKRGSAALFKSSFKINKAIDFPKLLNLVERFEEIMKLPPKYALNKVHLINPRHPQGVELIEKLDMLLMEELYEDCKKDRASNVDLCHSEFETYLEASRYLLWLNQEETISFDDAPTFIELVRELKLKGAYSDEDFYQFKHFVLLRWLGTYDDVGYELTGGRVIEHIHGEVRHEGNSFFKVDGSWYRVLPTFIRELNQECERIISRRWDTKLLDKPFDLAKSEAKYNRSYIGRPQTLVFDTITPDNIEVCDIMFWDHQNIYLVHVKKGFDNSVRELTSQLMISAKKLEEDIRAGSEGLRKLEDMTKRSNSQEIRQQVFPKGGLQQLFTNVQQKNIVFCLAIVDRADKDRSIKDNINDFQSNIAKYSLLDMEKQVSAMGFDVKIIQVKRK